MNYKSLHVIRKSLKTNTGPVGVFTKKKSQIGSAVLEIFLDRQNKA